jgi:hypothetical protein
MLGSRADSVGETARGAAAAASGDFDSEPHAPASDEHAGPEVTDEDIPF